MTTTTTVSTSALKVSVKAGELAAALGAVTRVISNRTTLPVLNNVLFEAKDGSLSLTATNLEIGIRKVVECEVGVPGATTVPARLLMDFVASLPPAQTLTMELDPVSNVLALEAVGVDAHIHCMLADEFPPGPTAEDGDRLSLPLADLLAAVEQTGFAASTDEARPVLTGVLLDIQQRVLDQENRRVDELEVVLVATDGHRLSERRLAPVPSADGSGLEAKLIVPARALAELPRAFRGESGEIEILVAKARNQVFFRAGRAQVASRLIDGQYPNYGQVIPTRDPQTTVTVDRAALQAALKVVGNFAKDSAATVRLKAGDGRLAISTATKEVGDSSGEVDASVKGDELEMAFNVRYVIDAAEVVAGDRVEFRFDGPLAPALIQPAGSDNHRQVIMPIRVGATR